MGIVEFFRQSYRSHPLAFYLEMVSAITVIIGSAILTYTVIGLEVPLDSLVHTTEGQHG